MQFVKLCFILFHSISLFKQNTLSESLRSFKSEEEREGDAVARATRAAAVVIMRLLLH